MLVSIYKNILFLRFSDRKFSWILTYSRVFSELTDVMLHFSNCFFCQKWSFRNWLLSFRRDVGQRRSSVATTMCFRCSCSDQSLTLLHVVFSTSIFRPDTKVVVTTRFWRSFSDENLTLYQRHYDSLFPMSCKLSFNSSFW